MKPLIRESIFSQNRDRELQRMEMWHGKKREWA
jgi:hypothetical protein